MSSLWGYTDIVLEGESGKHIYALLERAKEESGKEENEYCSEVISVGDAEYCFGYGIKEEYRNASEDNEFSPLVLVGKHPVFNHFTLYKCPIDEDERTFTFEGNIKFEYDGVILKICESTYASQGLMLTFLYAVLGENCPELYYWANSEADWLGVTNDQNHKYFNPEQQ